MKTHYIKRVDKNQKIIIPKEIIEILGRDYTLVYDKELKQIILKPIEL